MSCVTIFIIVLLISFVNDSSQCSEYDFPCDNKECIDAGLWCDEHEDCSDGSDEKYCEKATAGNTDPNKCPPNYFKCSDGPCIPNKGRCDNYENCEDGSDEMNCSNRGSSSNGGSTSPAPKSTTNPPQKRTTAKTTSKPTARSTTHPSPVKTKESRNTYSSNSSGSNRHPVENKYLYLDPSNYSHQREKARKWLLSQRRENFGWGDETPRALTALYLSDVERSTKRSESDMLMVKQLELELSLAIARNRTKTIKLTDLALYVNALLASCKDPRNFYGENLVRALRNGVDVARRSGAFVNPSVYLTLCVNNATTYEDTRNLQEIHISRNGGIGRMDIQALTLLTTICIHQSTNLISTSTYDNLRMQFLHRMKTSGFPGNVYEAALLMQALQELKVSLPGLLKFILEQQLEDGSFGGILSTYLVLPVLSGRSLLQMNDCDQRYSTDPAPLEVLKNVKRRKIHIHYTLKYGATPEIVETIKMEVAEGITFLDVMRLAQEINPKYRFILDENRDVPVVYSIGGIPNDAEKGMFWTLHFGRLSPYTGNIKQLIPRADNELVFWMKSI